ncbi:hypothetical protein ACSFB7_24440 [Variovorax sp. GB1P17]
MNCNPPRIYPRITRPDFLHESEPMPDTATTPEGHPRAQTPVARAVAGDVDLRVTYAIEFPTQRTTLTHGYMKQLGLDAQGLHAQAVDNLHRKANSKAATQDLVAYKALVTGDGLEACMLLLPDLWAKLSTGFKGELIAVVPSKDALYFMDSQATLTVAGQPISTTTRLALMCSAAARVKAEAGAHGLSDQVIALTPEGWKVRGTFGAHASVLPA